MAKKKQKDDEVLLHVEESLGKAEQYIENNKNTLMIVVGAILLIVGGYIGYTRFYIAPLQEEATREMFQAEQYFQQDSLQLALNGDGNNAGFIDIIDEYGATKAANLAHYYAGIAYLRMGDYAQAIEYLDQFNSDDKMLAPVAKGAIGDAFLELGQPEEALEYYLKATKVNDNQFTNPIYLMRAAHVCEMLENYEEAIKHYERVQKEYPDSREANDIKKYIARAQARR